MTFSVGDNDKSARRVLGIEIHLRHPCAFHGSGAGTEREGGRISFPPSTQTGLPCASMACRVCRWIAEMSLPCPWSFAVPSHPTPMRLMSAGPRGLLKCTDPGPGGSRSRSGPRRCGCHSGRCWHEGGFPRITCLPDGSCGRSRRISDCQCEKTISPRSPHGCPRRIRWSRSVPEA